MTKTIAVIDGDSNDWEDYFYYDETSPSCLRRSVDWRTGLGHRILRAVKGDPVGAIDASGYYVTKTKGKSHKCHRIVYSLFGELLHGMTIDHINGDRSDNRIENLRQVEFKVNHRNRKLPITNTTGTIGVWLNTQKGKNKDYCRWVAEWHDLNGDKCYKYFPFSKYGREEGFRLACEYRAEMISLMNTVGAGYSDRHGENDGKTNCTN